MEMDVRREYARRLAEASQAYAVSLAATRKFLLGVLAVLVLLGVLCVKVVYGWVPVWWLLGPMVALVGLEPFWRRARHALRRAVRMLRFYEAAAGRADGTRVQSGETGEGFREVGHLYEADLDVLGAHSLFGMLATTRTVVGQGGLARLLLVPADAATVRLRQEAVRELTLLLDLREQVEMLGPSAYAQIPAESFETWLGGGVRVFAPWMRWVLGAMTAAWIVVAVAEGLRGGEVPVLLRNVAGLLALQAAFALWLRERVVAELDAAQKLAGQTAILRDGLRLLESAVFESALLRGLQANAADGDAALKGLARSLQMTEQRAKEWFYLPSTLLGVGSQAAMALDAWRAEHGEALRRWLLCWADFEALLAMAVYAREHAENAWPEIVAEGEAAFAAEGLRHPLLGREAVANDIALGGEARFLLVSGSNMAGKSTLLRTIGTTAVLAMAGAPVAARSLRMKAMRVGASIRVGDSLADGRSKFLAEAERLRELLALAREHRGDVLFLIDEIFSGTNSADRRVAAEAVLRGLAEAGAIGALSTHDLALTEVEAFGGVNVHMASPVESDPLGFDYLLKPGVNRTTNALAIVKMLGLMA